ncbi:MAG: sulfofructosephosphate aldolase [Frankiaceae bacterium]|nr:sulfofructosephosphate aldolase [Frankiaceae bacterium]
MSTTPSLDAIARPSGSFAMVAMDQRESLRAMFDAAGKGRPADDVLLEFKLAVARVLAPHASGFLIDRHYGFETVRRGDYLGAGTGLILAADELQQEDGGPVEETTLDRIVVDETSMNGVAAIKLLIIWRRDERRAERVRLAQDFIHTARGLGVLSVLEPVVRATQAELDSGSWDGDAAIREAAGELSPLGASLYKAQVPRAGAGPVEQLEEACRALGSAITGPWVVLSQGVTATRFLGAVTAACTGGASGFLAGRALWADVVGDDDPDESLRRVSVPRLEALCDTVDRYARPWREAGASS